MSSLAAKFPKLQLLLILDVDTYIKKARESVPVTRPTLRGLRIARYS